MRYPLRKHAYSNIFKILQPKKRNFSDKSSDVFHISSQDIDHGVLVRTTSAIMWFSLEPHRRGGYNESPQPMVLSRNKKIMYTPVKPSFTIYKWGLRGSKLYRHVFMMGRIS